MLSQNQLEKIVCESGAVINGNVITFPIESLGEAAPSLEISSPENAAQEVGTFTLNNFCTLDDPFHILSTMEQAQGMRYFYWGPDEWEDFHDTKQYLRDSWSELAIRLMLANSAA